ncbi:BTB/POZ domain-containing protein, partial [Tanacetum coccineum]
MAVCATDGLRGIEVQGQRIMVILSCFKKVGGRLQCPIVQSSKWLAETIPEFARLDHDDLYRAIAIYLK